MITDIDELLSMLDDQRLVVHEPTNTVECNDSRCPLGSTTVGWPHKFGTGCMYVPTVDDAATRMRDRCLEKVEDYRQRIQYEKDEGLREALFGDMVIELQSMSVIGETEND